MRFDEIKTTNEAYSYFFDCQMATVDRYTLLSKPPVGEFSRHISIAQKMLDKALEFDIDLSGTRFDLLTKPFSVKEYVLKLRPKFKSN
tara:strand:+ start:79181 stop:79444 length:264 start_codon:yes stop_codon:yes gene_type:complete